jgi:hypothetical protein
MILARILDWFGIGLALVAEAVIVAILTRGPMMNTHLQRFLCIPHPNFVVSTLATV